ncbi:MAG: galactose mutarotase [Clostridia bacterium]|nr:galactose mutarotase [Clostridia bacterium]
MKKELFGRMPDGSEVYAYTLKNGKMEARILNLGGILSRLLVDGQNVILGFDTLEGVLSDTSYQGSMIGRYGNRIKDARFTIGGKEYKLFPNYRNLHALHGGKYGFNRKLWRAEPFGESELALFYRSPDGEEGYPGNLDVRVTYKLLSDALELHYEAIGDKDTFVNLTNHVYFNLDGASTEGDILDHTLQIHADTYTVVNETMIPIGREKVENTRFDFRTAKKIGRDLKGTSLEDPDFTYDSNYNLDGRIRETVDGRELALAATLSNGRIKMDVLTELPGLQCYTSGLLANTDNPLSGGVIQHRRMAIALETQAEPDAPTRGENLLKAGTKYDTVTVYRFS